MGIILYTSIYFFTFILALFPRAIPNQIFFMVWFCVMVGLSLSLRLGYEYIPESDFDTMAVNMKITGYIIPYHAREFVFWLGSRYLYQLFQDPNIVFIIMDLFMFLTFYRGLYLLKGSLGNNSDDIKYLIFCAFIFLPYYYGLNNTYRGIFGSCVAICGLGYFSTKPKTGLLFFIISFFIHNSMIMLLPVYFFIRQKRVYNVLATVTAIVVFAGMVIAVNLSDGIIARMGGVEIGRKIGLFYLGVIVLIGMFIVIIDIIVRKNKNIFILQVLLYFNVLYAFAYLTVPSQSAERIMFLILSVLYPLVGIYLAEGFRSDPVLRLIYSHIGIATLSMVFI